MERGTSSASSDPDSACLGLDKLLPDVTAAKGETVGGWAIARDAAIAAQTQIVSHASRYTVTLLR